MAQTVFEAPDNYRDELNTTDSAERGVSPKTLVEGINAMMTELYAGGAGSLKNIDVFIPALGAAKLGTSAAGWTLDGANNLPLQTLAAGQTAEEMVIPLMAGLQVGDLITAVSVVGQVESAGNIATLSLDVRKVTAAAADFADASIGTDASGNLTADTIISGANVGVTALTETLAADEFLYAVLTGTTAASTDIAIAGLVVSVTRAR